MSTEALVELIQFPADVESILALLEARLNVLTCKVCGARVAYPVPLACINSAGHRAVVVAPPSAATALEAEFKDAGLAVHVVSDYVALYSTVVPWVNEIVQPAGTTLLNSSYLKLDRAAQIRCFPPLFLRLMKAQADGSRVQCLQLTGGSDDELRATFRQMWHALLGDQVNRILLEACRTRQLFDIAEKIEDHIPVSCVDGEALAAYAERCQPINDAGMDAMAFMANFRNELMHAVLAAHAGIANPRSRAWADCLTSVWRLSKREDVKLDPLFMLPAALVQRITRFEDLWDATVAEWQPENFKSALDDAEQMMTHWGYRARLEQLLAAGIVRVKTKGSPKERASAAERLLGNLVQMLTDNIRLNESGEASEEAGPLVGGSVRFLLNSGHPAHAAELARRLMDVARTAGDKAAVAAIAAHATEPLNAFHQFLAARALIADAAEYNADLSSVSPALALRFLVELGNCARYAHEYDKALEMYEAARSVLPYTKESDYRAANADAVQRNIAIVLRQLRRYGEALSILQDYAAKHPGELGGWHSLAAVHAQTGNLDAALTCIDKAVACTAGAVKNAESADLLVSRAHIRRLVNRHDEALADCQMAMASEGSESVRLRAAAVALLCESDRDAGRATIEHALGIVRDAVESTTRAQVTDDRATVLVAMAEYLLRAEGLAKAKALLDETSERWGLTDVSLPWQFQSLNGWIAHLTGDDELAWRSLHSAMLEVDEDVPEGAEASFATGWLHDKSELQKRATQVALSRVRRGELDPRELLHIYEFVNGRELAARLGGLRAADLDVRAALARAPRAVDCYVSLDAGTEVALIRVGRRGEEVELIEMPPLDVEAVSDVRRRTLLALKRANPLDLTAHDRAMGPWRAIASLIGSAIAPHVRRDTHIAFLPGRALTGMPLHTVPVADGRALVEHTTVSYAPNFATLFAPPAAASGNVASVVAMCKENDTDAFLDGMRQAKEHLVAELRKRAAEVVSLDGPAQGKADVLALLARADEVVFLCHGYDGGPTHGFGICVAAHGRAPPPLLAVDRLAELRDFMITWPDLEALSAVPALIVSMACSTGMTVIGNAGVRYGLEQTAFAGGTRAIVSPLWDVEQRASRAWLEHFYASRNEGMELVEAYRWASLRAKKDYPHPYFWAPFVLSGSIL